MYSDDDLEAIRLVAARIERRRRLGVLLMYSPTLFLMLIMGTVVSAIVWSAGGPSQQLPSAVQAALLSLAVAFAVSWPIAFAGVTLRVISGKRLDRFTRDWNVEELPPRPHLQAREQLGFWRVVRAIPGQQISIRRCPAPRVVIHAMRWGCLSFFLLMAIASIGAAWHGHVVLAIGPVFVVLTFGFWIFDKVLVDGTIAVRRRDGSAEVVRTWSWLALLPRSSSTYAGHDVKELCLNAESVTISLRHGVSLTISDFTPGPFGWWQAARLAAAIGEVLGLEPTLADASAEDDD